MSADFLAAENQINIYQGESATITLKVTDSANKAVDLTDGAVIMTVKTSIYDSAPLFQKYSTEVTQIAITEPRAGKAEIYISSSDTSTLDPVSYIYDIWVILESGKKHPVIKPSILVIKPSITRFG